MTLQPLAAALVHAPVVDRRGDLVTTAVTNLDLHDIARSARTFGLQRFYVVTPVAEQQRLVKRLLGHWVEGSGAAYNPKRRQALELIRVVSTFKKALADWREITAAEPLPVLTGASRDDGISFETCRGLMQKQPGLLVFGTGWGLAPEFFENGWHVLEPVRGVEDYNHLSVRAAAAIILDRLAGRSGNN
ncbi:MAG: hypothetical protein C0615_11920 [Desulfuromonas sp.]|nr:MAG: hypothetical protein C0615_11920 [Desulfuromonas sp.]